MISAVITATLEGRLGIQHPFLGAEYCRTRFWVRQLLSRSVATRGEPRLQAAVNLICGACFLRNRQDKASPGLATSRARDALEINREAGRILVGQLQTFTPRSIGPGNGPTDLCS